MGFFSWKTSDTRRSIANNSSSLPVFRVHMITRDGRVFTEKDYEGYGIFGGKDFYELVAELNGKGSNRSAGINVCFAANGGGDCDGSFVAPKLVERLMVNHIYFGNGQEAEYKKQFAEWFDKLPHSTNCEDQGYFYDDGADDRDFNENYNDDDEY